MRWTNKIMLSNQEESSSRVSSRSLSRFKKVNLQKQEVEISSNEQLEKSQLKLTSVQKIKLSNINRSYISSYIAHGATNQATLSTSAQKPTYRFSNLTNKQHNQHINISKSQRIFHPQTDNDNGVDHIKPLQGYALFRKDTQKSYTSSEKQRLTGNNQSAQWMLKNVVERMRLLFLEFRDVSESIKQHMNQSVKNSFQLIQNSLITCVKQFQSHLQTSIQQLINLTKTQPNSTSAPVQTTFPFSPQSESFYKIKYFDHQKVPSRQVEYGKSRPNSFKDKFKQIIDDSDHGLAAISQLKQQQQLKRTLESKERSASKIFRKRTNPTPRVNTLLDNDSSFLNESSLNQEHNASTNSIKYCKMKERSASRSVKKLHDKIILIKSIFKSETTRSGTDNNSNPVQDR